jgi:hypothetical protein
MRRGRFFVHLNPHCRRNRTSGTPRTQPLHSYRDRRGGALCLDSDSWCLSTGLRLTAMSEPSGLVSDPRSEPTLAIATDAVSNPTTRRNQSGGKAEVGTRQGHEGSIPFSTTEHQYGAPQLDNDRVVQRGRAGQHSHNRPAPPSSRPACSGGTLASSLCPMSEFLSFLKKHGLDSFDSICWGPVRTFSLFRRWSFLRKTVRTGRSGELTPVRA